ISTIGIIKYIGRLSIISRSTTNDLFNKENITTRPSNSNKTKVKSIVKPNTQHRDESWCCFLCNLDRQADMRSCVGFRVWIHEECAGLISDDE
ncbi:hypothetical protein HHI36_009566, partial [Cryptolaemus montrouzieri]